MDEEIGTVARFQADPDDLLPQVMGFGKGTYMYIRGNSLLVDSMPKHTQ